MPTFNFNIKPITDNIIDLNNEKWKILNENNNYSISNLGRIKNNITNVLLHPDIHNKGYYRIFIKVNNHRTTLFIHRLVAKYFVNNENGYNIVDHIDGNKLNNKIDNLEWCSASHNTKHAWQNSLIVPSEKFKERASRQFIKNLADKQRKLNNEIADNIIEIYNNKNISMKKLGALFNVSSQTVCNIIHGKRYLV